MLLQRAIEQLQPGVDQPDVDQPDADMDPASTQLLGQILARVGAVYANVPDKTHAVPLLEQSLTYLSEPRERALVLAHLGYAISLQGENAKAEALLHESLTISRQWNDLHVQGYALHRLSCLGWARAEHLQSRALGRESLTIYRTLGRPDRIAHVLSDLAVTETWLGDYATATVHLQESLAICRRLGYRHGEAWALNGLGFVALWQGEDFKSAAALTRESLAIYQSTGHSFAMCLSFGDLAVIYRSLGEHEQAVQFGQAGVGVARTLQSDYALSHMLIFLGCAQIGSGDLVAARRTLVEAMLLARSIHHVFCMTNGLFYLAELLIEESRLTQGDAALALQCQALEWLVFLQEYPGSWHCYKRESARLATQLAAVLPAQQIAAAQAKGKMLTLSEVVHFVLNQP
jgi:tetratricopeptide (TPR) repeat protein